MLGRPRSQKTKKPKGPFQNTSTSTVHTVFPGARTTVPQGGRLSTGAVLFPSRGVHCSGYQVLSPCVFQGHFYPELGKLDSVQRPLRARLPLSFFLGFLPSKGSTPLHFLCLHIPSFLQFPPTPLASYFIHPYPKGWHPQVEGNLGLGRWISGLFAR